MNTLTRAEAHDLVDDCGASFGMLRALARAWVGHDEYSDAEIKGFLHEYVDECAGLLGDDEQRSNGPKDTDDTGLSDPEAEQPQPNYGNDNALRALSDVLSFWCAGQELPYMSADDLLHGVATRDKLSTPQRNWLAAYVRLWNETADPGLINN